MARHIKVEMGRPAAPSCRRRPRAGRRCGSANQPEGDADLREIFPAAIGSHGRNLAADGQGEAGAIREAPSILAR